jgi:photosystem II stability/assembly factor-like uncharacterized protein
LPATPGRYEDLYFLNQNTGWVVEAAMTGRILKTTNGGANFTIQFTGDTLYFRSVAFNNSQLGWAGTLDGDLLKTTNGGINWLKIDTMIHPRLRDFVTYLLWEIHSFSARVNTADSSFYQKHKCRIDF